MKPIIALAFAAIALASSGCVNPAFNEFPEFARFKKEAKGRFVGCLGYSLEVPGYDGFLKSHTLKDVFIIPSTSDFYQSEEVMNWNIRSRAFAKRYNEWLRKQRDE